MFDNEICTNCEYCVCLDNILHDTYGINICKKHFSEKNCEKLHKPAFDKCRDCEAYDSYYTIDGELKEECKREHYGTECKLEHTGNISHPSHYCFGKYEPVDVIHDWQLGFNKGNALKYIARAGRKDKDKEMEDLKKAIQYLQFEIGYLENDNN